MPTAPTRTTPTFPAKGSLKRVPFARLIREIARSSATGNLYLLTAGDKKKVVFFANGTPVFVRSNQLSECLGQVLAEEGLITQEQSDNTLEAVRRTGKKQGELLVENGILSRGNLHYGLYRQLRQKLFEIFAWEEGRFQFKPGGDAPDDVEVGFEEPVEAIIITATQERCGDARARRLLEGMKGEYPRPTSKWKGDPNKLGLLPEERHFLQCVDGSRSLTQLLDEAPQPPVPQVSTLLLGLVEAGVLELAAVRRPPRKRPDPPDLTPKPADDDELAPSFDATSAIKEFEDTPLPRQLPNPASSNAQLPTLLSEDEEMFAGVAALADEDSMLVDSAELLRGPTPTQRPVSAPAPEPEPEPAPALSSPGDFAGRIGALVDDDDEADFGGLDEPTRTDVAPIELEQEPTRTTPTIIDDVSAPAPSEGEELIELIDDDEMLELEADDVLDDADLLDDDPEELDSHALQTINEPDVTYDKLAAEAAASPHEPAELETAAALPLPTLDDDEELPPLDELPELDGELPDLDPDSELPDLGDIDDDLLDELDDELGALDGAELDELGLDDVDLDEVDLDAVDLGDFEPEPAPAAPAQPAPKMETIIADVDLDDLDLDAIDLGDIDGEPEPEYEPELEVLEDLDDEPDPRAYEEGQMLFNEGVSAMHEGDYATAVQRFEEAYDHGLDDAELRAMIAFARFRNNGGDEATAHESLEQLTYAEEMDPNLDLVYAYRGAIYLGLGIEDQARESFRYALQLNPDCVLANDYINNM